MNKLLAIAALAAIAVTAPAAATTYANSYSAQIGAFGSPDTTTYGQVFTAPADTLTSWTFYTDDASNDGARLVIAAWGGSGVSGGELFSELTQTVFASSGAWAHQYDGINLALTGGNSYIAYITVAGVANPTGQVLVNGSGSSPLGGLFVFNNSNGVDPLSNNGGWYTSGWTPYNMQYTAVFGAVPEPASWALMIAGFGMVGVAARRRRTLVAA